MYAMAMLVLNNPRLLVGAGVVLALGSLIFSKSAAKDVFYTGIGGVLIVVGYVTQ